MTGQGRHLALVPGMEKTAGGQVVTFLPAFLSLIVSHRALGRLLRRRAPSSTPLGSREPAGALLIGAKHSSRIIWLRFTPHSRSSLDAGGVGPCCGPMAEQVPEASSGLGRTQPPPPRKPSAQGTLFSQVGSWLLGNARWADLGLEEGRHAFQCGPVTLF